jgi:hypothetical protein
MMEALFGSAAPMWTTLPPTGFGLHAPIAFGNGPIGQSVFGPPSFAGPASAVAAPPQSLPGPAPIPTSPYGQTPGMIPVSSQSLGGPAFPRGPSFFMGTEPLVALTAPALVAAVAMRRGQPQGPTNDQEIEDFVYDALELVPGTSDVEVRCEGGRATLAGSVQHKRIKRDVGEIAWALPVVHDVQNNLAIASRRRSRGSAREGEGAANIPNRKQS